MNLEKLASIVKREFETSIGRPGQELSEERAKAWNRYLSKPLGNEVEGESEVVTSDVADVVDGIMPSFLRVFTTADNVCNFDPVNPEDVLSAQQESDYVNHVFYKENDAFMITYNWIFDAVMHKNGVTMAYWDESEKVSQETYSGYTILDVEALLEEPGVRAVEREDMLDADGELMIDPITQEPLQKITIKRVTKAGKVTVDNVPPEEFRISVDARSVVPKCRMVGRERHITRSDLIGMGFDPDMVKELSCIDTRRPGVEQARHEDTEQLKAQDKSQERVELREAYIQVDYDDDGVSELRQVFVGGGKVLKWKDGKEANAIVDRHPFHVICPTPLPHRHIGRGIAERAIDIQETSTTLLRQVLMNLYHTNNPGHAVDQRRMGENTLDDLLTTEIGRTVRFNGNPGESWAPMTVPFTAGASFPMLEYFEKVKRDRTGVSSDAEGLSPDALKHVQQSVLVNSLDMSRMKIEAIARIFAETGFKSLFLHIHELLIKHMDKAKIVRLRNEWVPVDPRLWKHRMDMTVNIGLGVGSREQKRLELEAIWQKQSEMASGGGMNLTVKPKHFYNTAVEMVKNSGYKDSSLFFENPGDQLAPPPQDEAQELQKMQAQIQQRQQELDAVSAQIKSAKLELDRQSEQLKHQREMLKVEEQSEARKDRFAIENERLRNDLAKLQSQVSADVADRPLEHDKKRAEIDEIRSRAQRNRAEIIKVKTEVDAAELELAATESGLAELLSGESTEAP